MLARIAWMAVLLYGGAASPLASPTSNIRTFAHQCDLCQLVRSAPGSEFSAAPHANGAPSRIILMRHADKPDDPDDPDLSAAGVERAEHLATYIPQTFGKPDYIIATARSKHSDRPFETVEPLARGVGVTVQHDIRDKDFEDLIDEIFSDEAYRGKTVVISWHHGTLPARPFDEPSRLLIAKVSADLALGRRAEGLFRGKLISGRGADPLSAPQRLCGSAPLIVMR